MEIASIAQFSVCVSCCVSGSNEVWITVNSKFRATTKQQQQWPSIVWFLEIALLDWCDWNAEFVTTKQVHNLSLWPAQPFVFLVWVNWTNQFDRQDPSDSCNRSEFTTQKGKQGVPVRQFFHQRHDLCLGQRRRRLVDVWQCICCIRQKIYCFQNKTNCCYRYPSHFPLKVAEFAWKHENKVRTGSQEIE